MRERKPDIKTLALRKPWLFWLLLFCTTSLLQFTAWWQFLPGGPAWAETLRLVHLVLHIPAAILLVLILRAKDEYKRVMALFGVLMFAPDQPVVGLPEV